MQEIVLSPGDIATLREVVTVLHDHYDVIDPLVLDSSPERLLTFRDRLEDAEPVSEGRAVSLAATDLIHLNMAVMMAADCYDDLPLRKKGISEADLEALTERITALEDRHFPHLRGAGISPRRP